MKRRLAALMILTMVFTMTACGNRNDNETSRQSQLSSPVDDASDSSGETSDLEGEQGSGSSSQDDDMQNPDNLEELTENGSSEQAGSGQESPEQDAPVQGSNILVAYFSRVGNTNWEDGVDAVTSASLNVIDGEYFGNAQLLAQMAREVTGGELFMIQTKETYPSAYRDTTDAAKEEQNVNARPELASHVENIDQYDTIVLVYPNWWGTLPMPLYTFLEEYDFSGKTILPLCTHEGSRMGSSESAIAQICPDASLVEGLSVRGSSASSAQSDVEAWIIDSGILE